MMLDAFRISNPVMTSSSGSSFKLTAKPTCVCAIVAVCFIGGFLTFYMKDAGLQYERTALTWSPVPYREKTSTNINDTQFEQLALPSLNLNERSKQLLVGNS